MIEGLVIQHGANRYLVQARPEDGGELWACAIAGRLLRGRQRQVRVAVIGDRVRFKEEPSSQGLHGVIQEILPRENQISRPAPSGGRRQIQEQVVIANLDRLWIIASLASPALNLMFVDRILAAARHQEVDCGLVLNKADLEEAADPVPVRALYESLGTTVHLCSVLKGQGIEELRGDLARGIGAFVGLSGVGKSSLIAALEPGLELRISSVGEKSGQGRHTTSTSRLFPLGHGGYLADTPGMREFGLWGMARGDLGACFVEFAAHVHDCRFRDCLHDHEPGCAVRAAVEEGELDAGRYRRYLGLLEELPASLSDWRDRRN
jgi:ribosome biogenesis GTPase